MAEFITEIFTPDGFIFRVLQIVPETDNYALCLDSDGDLYATPYEVIAVIEVKYPKIEGQTRQKQMLLTPLTGALLERITDTAQNLDLSSYLVKYVKKINRGYFNQIMQTLTETQRIPIKYEKNYSNFFLLNPNAATVINNLDQLFGDYPN
jgi:hypothetical protein